MKCLIIGASSYVGARLYVDLSKKYEIVGTYYSKHLTPDLIPLDITNHLAVVRCAQQIKPDIIIHVAAHASSKWCDLHPQEAVAINQTAARYIVEAANMVQSKVIYISSFAAIYPINLYGRTKLESENEVKKTDAGYLILRPSLIVGLSPNTENDRPFNRLLKNLTGTPAVYDTSWQFQPTYLGHLSESIEMAIKKDIWNTTIPVATDVLKTRYELAVDILKPFNINVSSIDGKERSPVLTEDITVLQRLGLPEYSYSKLINKIVEEIKMYRGKI